jgi:hypothetical protein
MKHLRAYKLFESSDEVTPIQQEVIDDVTNILADLSDDGYIVSVGMKDENQNYVFPGASKLLTVEITADSYMDMDVVSDYLIRLYDYMKEHQTAFNRNPSNASVSNSGRTSIKVYTGIGWGQLDKSNVSAYNQLLNSKNFTGVLFQWQQKPVRIS